MFKQIVENVRAQDRDYFKSKIESFHPFFHINCKGDKAVVQFKEPYVFDTNDIQEKGKALTMFRAFLNEFRHYQFNN
jgi:hypothetical protein